MPKPNVVSIKQARRPRKAGVPESLPTPSAAVLRALPLDEVLALFHGLEAPVLGEMDGDYVATLLDHGGTLQNVISFLATNVPNRWLGKAFHALDGEVGEGHNWFQGRNVIERRYRMKTYVAASALDSGRSYVLEYRPFNTGFMKTMVDEVRRVSPGLYLGVGRVGLGRWMRTRFYPFLLEGPIGPFVDPAPSATRRTSSSEITSR